MVNYKRDEHGNPILPFTSDDALLAEALARADVTRQFALVAETEGGRLETENEADLWARFAIRLREVLAERAAYRDRWQDAERELVLAGVRGSPPPGGVGTIPRLAQEIADLRAKLAAAEARAKALRHALVGVVFHTGRLPGASPELLNGLLDSCARIANAALDAAENGQEASDE